MPKPAKELTSDRALNIVQELISRQKNSCYLVGGTVRDFLLSRPTKDFDLAVSKNPEQLAKIIAGKLKGSFLTLKEEWGIYRVVIPNTLQLDFARFKGADIISDLAHRDFSINAMAVRLPIADCRLPISDLIDPHEGKKDIGKKIVRQISPLIYSEDPLRLLRAFRMAVQLGFQIDLETFQTIKKNKEKIREVSAERIREELLLILDSSRSYSTIRKLDETGLISLLFPEVDPNRDCAQQYYPDKGVWGHSLDGLNCLEWILNNLASEFPRDFEKIRELVLQKGAGTEGHPRSTLMKLAILFHDIGKASTAKMIDGRMRFFKHEDVGALITKKIAKRLRFSSDAVTQLSKLVQAHMRPGGLAHAQILTERAKYRFFRDLGFSAIPMLIVSLADRYTYLNDEERGKEKDLHEKIVKELVNWHYEKKIEESASKIRLINGDILIEKLGLQPGPLIGEILKSAEEAQAIGEITSPQEAIEFAKKRLENHLGQEA